MHRFVCDRMLEIQLISTQPDRLPAFCTSKSRVIFCISNNRTTDRCELYTDLMMAAGIQMDFQLSSVESRDTIRANTRYVGGNGVRVVVEKNERYAL